MANLAAHIAKKRTVRAKTTYLYIKMHLVPINIPLTWKLWNFQRFSYLGKRNDKVFDRLNFNEIQNEEMSF